MLTKQQYHKLKSINRKGHATERDFRKNEQLFWYLAGKNFIRKTRSPDHKVLKFIITETGKAELASYETERFRFWLPNVLSSIALISQRNSNNSIDMVSAIALTETETPDK